MSNYKLCRIVGYNRGELTQLAFQEITSPEDLYIDLKYFQDCITVKLIESIVRNKNK